MAFNINTSSNKDNRWQSAKNRVLGGSSNASSSGNINDRWGATKAKILYGQNVEPAKEERGTLDRIFGVLGYTGVVEGLYNMTDNDPNSTFLSGLREGFKYMNPFEDDVSGRHYFSDILKNTNYFKDDDPDSIDGKDVARGVVSFLGDVALDPLSYINPYASISKVIKGTGKVATAAETASRVGKKIDDVKNGSFNTQQIRSLTKDEALDIISKSQGKNGFNKSPEELDAAAERLVNGFNRKILKQRNANDGIGFSVGIPFTKLQKELISSKSLRTLGDKTISPYYNRVAKNMRTSKLGQALSKKNQLEALSLKNFDEAVDAYIASDIDNLYKTNRANFSSEAYQNVNELLNQVPDETDRAFIIRAIEEGVVDTAMAKNIFKKHGLEELLKMIDSDAPDDVVKIKSIKEQINKDKEKLFVLSGIKADADELRDSFGKTSSKLNGDYDNRSFIKFNDDISILDDLDIQSFKKSVFDNPYVQKIYDYVVDLSPQAAYDYLLKEKKYYTNRADDIKEQVEKFGGKNSLFDDSLISGLRDTTDIISEIDNMIEHVSKQFADDAEFVTPFIKSKLDGDAIRNVLNELAFGGQTIRDDIGSGIYVNSPLINNANFDDETVDRFSELLSSNKREEAMDMLRDINAAIYNDSVFDNRIVSNVASKIAQSPLSHKFDTSKITLDFDFLEKLTPDSDGVLSPYNDIVLLRNEYKSNPDGATNKLVHVLNKAANAFGLNFKDFMKLSDDEIFEIERIHDNVVCDMFKKTRTRKQFLGESVGKSSRDYIVDKYGSTVWEGLQEHSYEFMLRTGHSLENASTIEAEKMLKILSYSDDLFMDTSLGKYIGTFSHPYEYVYKTALDSGYDIVSPEEFRSYCAQKRDYIKTNKNTLVSSGGLDASKTRGKTYRSENARTAAIQTKKLNQELLSLQSEAKELLRKLKLVDKKIQGDHHFVNNKIDDIYNRYLYIVDSEIPKIQNQMTSIPSGFDDTKLSSQNRLIRKGINLSSDRLAGIRARANESLTHYGVANKKIVNSIAFLNLDDALKVFENASTQAKKSLIEFLNEEEVSTIEVLFRNASGGTRKFIFEEYLPRIYWYGDYDISLMSNEMFEICSQRISKAIQSLSSDIETFSAGFSGNVSELALNSLYHDALLCSKLDCTIEYLNDVRKLTSNQQLIEAVNTVNSIMRRLGEQEVKHGRLSRSQFDIMSNRYIHHMLTPEGKALFDKLTDAQKASIGFNPDSIGIKQSFRHKRTFRTIDEANSYFSKTFGVENVFETELANIILARELQGGELISRDDCMTILKNSLAKRYEPNKGVPSGRKLTLSYEEIGKVLREKKKLEEEGFSHGKKIKKHKNKINESYEKLVDFSVLKNFGIDPDLVSPNNPFIEITEEQYKKFKEYLGEDLSEKLVGYCMYDSVLKIINCASLAQTREAESCFWKIYDKLLNFYKTINTTVSPGFHLQNAFGNACNSFFYSGAAAFNPKKLKIAHTIAINPDPKQTMKFTHGVLKGKTLTYKQLNELLSKYEIIEGSFWKKEIASSDIWPLGWAKQKGTNIENTQRCAMFIEALKNGESFEGAKEIVNRFLFDYGDLTDVEKTWFRRAIPFYTYMRKNVPLQLEMMIEMPEVFRNLNYGLTEFELLNGENYIPENDRNEWYQDYIQLPFNVDNEPFGIDLNFPLEQLDRLSPNRLIGQSSPVIKIPYELATGKYAYTGIPIEDDYITSLFSPANTVNVANKKFEEDESVKKAIFTLSRFGLGMPAGNISRAVNYESNSNSANSTTQHNYEPLPASEAQIAYIQSLTSRAGIPVDESRVTNISDASSYIQELLGEVN